METNDMVIRRWALATLVCGLLVLAGCGNDSGDDTPPRAGMSGGQAGTGTMLSVDDALAGACMMQEDLSKCMGLEETTNCVLSQCGLQQCLDTVCKTYQQCLEAAPDPCNAPSCVRPPACTTCVKDVPTCLLNMCVSNLKCD